MRETNWYMRDVEIVLFHSQEDDINIASCIFKISKK